MKIVRWVLILLAVAIAGTFAVNNRHPVTVDLWPFPYELEVRLVLLLLAVLFVGFLLGYVARMIGMLGRHRRKPRSTTQSHGSGLPTTHTD